MKTHFAVKPPFDTTEVSACGRGKRITINIYRVDCLLCQSNDAFILAMDEAKSAAAAAYEAQVPRTIVPQFGRVNDDGVMECPKCQGVLWKEKPRNLWSYHYVCQGCQFSVHPLTETGMCQ